MKILQVNCEKQWRGGERQTLYLMEELYKHNCKVDLICKKHSPLFEKARLGGFTVYAIDGKISLLYFLLKHAYKYDILHAQTANSLTFLILSKFFHRRPIFFTRRTAFPTKVFKKIFTYIKWCFVDCFVCISDFSSREPLKLGFSINIIRSSVRFTDFSNLEEVAKFKESINPRNLNVLSTVAALSWEKDPITLVRSIKHLCSFRDDFIFLHFGIFGNAYIDTIKEIEKLNLSSKYILVGFKDEIEKYYSIMDIFIISSIEEALGSSVLDSFLNRIPVVSTNAGGLKELLSDDRGIICNIRDYVAIAEGINSLLNNKKLSNNNVKQAYNYVLKNHSTELMGNQYLSLYRKFTK